MENLLQQDVNVGTLSMISLIITAILLFLLPVAFAFLWKKRCGGSVSLMPLLFGAVGFIVSARVLEQGIHTLCLVIDSPVSRFLNGNTAAFVIYGIFMAGIFEECGRYIIIKFIIKKDMTRENTVMYGIGHGGMEVWSISLLSIVNLLLTVLLIKAFGMEKALPLMGVTGELSENTVNSITAVINSAANFSLPEGGLAVLERVTAMITHISLTITVAYGIVKNKLHYLFLAISAHALVDLLPALYQRGAVSLLAAELWLCFCAVLLAVFGVRLYKKFPEQRENLPKS